MAGHLQKAGLLASVWSRHPVRGEFLTGFKLALHLKDLRICTDMAHVVNGRLPLVEQTIPAYEQPIQSGHADENISALYCQLKLLFTPD